MVGRHLAPKSRGMFVHHLRTYSVSFFGIGLKMFLLLLVIFLVPDIIITETTVMKTYNIYIFYQGECYCI